MLHSIFALAVTQANIKRRKPKIKTDQTDYKNALLKEYELTQQKKSKLSANERKKIIYRVETYYSDTKD